MVKWWIVSVNEESCVLD